MRLRIKNSAAGSFLMAGLLLYAPTAAVKSTQSRSITNKEEKAMLKGLRTVVYQVKDLEKAKEWYTRVLGKKPYFYQPFYVGFNVGGYELGLHPDASGATSAGGVYAYWGVDDAREAYKRLQELGATKHHDVQDVGEGILVADVMDPFGNIFGVIQNPHFKIE
jgi:predicted enzyme related to lactoylglutathione lyase